jgi:hypothetical protein
MSRPRRAEILKNLGPKLLQFAAESKRNLSLIQIRFFHLKYRDANTHFTGLRMQMHMNLR